MTKRALITGITGQDGSYLAELLLQEGYEVHGIVRRVALEDPEHRFWRLREVIGRITLHSASLESFASLYRVVAEVRPDECYHLAAQSFVSYSFDDEFSTVNTKPDALSVLARRPAPERGCTAGSAETKTPGKPQNG
jgi:GDPmannose 4,6-dehydratase